MNRQNRRRIWAARALLMVFLPMLFMSLVHIHHHVAQANNTACYACLHHLSHADHLQRATVDMQQCLYCHFMSVLSVLPVVMLLCTPQTGSSLILCSRQSHRVIGVYGACRLRAPPFA